MVMGMIAAPRMRANPAALDTPDQVVTCRAVCTTPLAGATCPSWERPLASREACPGPGDRRKLSNPRDATGAKTAQAEPASRVARTEIMPHDMVAVHNLATGAP